MQLQGRVMPKTSYTAEEVDQKIRRAGDPAGLTKDDLPTPALLVDLDVFEANLQKMAQHAVATGKALRSHAKTHKCVEIAGRQLQAGAIGVSVATVPEAEVMVASGVHGVLLTSPIASAHKMERIVRLVQQTSDVLVAVDHRRQVELYQEAAGAAGCTLNVLVDLNVGDRRTGTTPGEPALELAENVAQCQNLQFRGLQAYSGGSSHVVGFEVRRAHSHQVMAKAVQTRELLNSKGLPADILSGVSTGTYNIDSELAGVTELQAGSYIFMDVDYHRIGSRDSDQFNDFGYSLTVLATVVSTNHSDRVTIDAGFKSFATDRTVGPVPKGITGVKYGWGGDEFGILNLEDPSQAVKLGDRLELFVPHCDPTVNLYDRIFACRGERVEEVWPVMDRLR